jgi:hypothetical protein
MTNVDALKALYTGLGGTASTVADVTTIVGMLNAIAAMYSGDDDAEINADGIMNIVAVLSDIINEYTIMSLEVTPTTEAQTISATSSITGYAPISVKAVTAAIDSNIVAGNIKSGVTILGVTGSYTGD